MISGNALLSKRARQGNHFIERNVAVVISMRSGEPASATSSKREYNISSLGSWNLVAVTPGNNRGSAIEKYLETALSQYGSTIAGGLVGTLTGKGLGHTAVASSAGALVGLAGGAFVYNASRDLLRRLRDEVEIRRLLAWKCKADFRHSFLLDALEFDSERKDAKVRLSRAKEKVRKLKVRRFPDEEWQIFDRVLPPEQLWKDVEQVRSYGTVKINCSAICVGMACVIASLNERFETLKLEPSFSDPNGRAQAATIANRKDYYDFAVLPLDPFVLTDPGAESPYKLLGPVYYEEQFMFRRRAPNNPYKKGVGVHIWDLSTAKMQWLLGKNMPGNSTPVDIPQFSDLPSLANELPGNDYVLAWDPLCHLFRRRHKEFDEVAGTDYHGSFYLVGHERLRNGALNDVKESFKRLLQNEWRLCSANPMQKVRAVRKNSEFMRSFAQGAGLTWTPEIG